MTEWRNDDMVICRWFLLCGQAATGTITHPVLGEVPICDRCRRLATPKKERKS